MDSADMALDMKQKIEAVLPAATYRVQLLPVNPAKPEGRKELAWTGQHEGAETHYSKEPHTSFSARNIQQRRRVAKVFGAGIATRELTLIDECGLRIVTRRTERLASPDNRG